MYAYCMYDDPPPKKKVAAACMQHHRKTLSPKAYATPHPSLHTTDGFLLPSVSFTGAHGSLQF